MISESCRAALEEWVQGATWQTRREPDIARFNRAVAVGIVDRATIQQFQLAVRDVVRGAESEFANENLENVLGDYVRRADAVFDFHRTYSGA